MTFHRRSDWTKTPAANANPVVRGLLEGVAIHWNGPAVPNSALTDPRSYLEGVRRFHVSGRGWSDIAYNVAVDQLGNRWQLRGFGHQSGANGDEDVNNRFLAILAILGEGQKPSRAMKRGIRREVLRFRLRYPRARKIVGHRDIRPGGTECPGPDLYAAVQAGEFRPAKKKPELVCLHCPTHCPKETK